jgi:hypothetical protein
LRAAGTESSRSTNAKSSAIVGAVDSRRSLEPGTERHERLSRFGLVTAIGSAP